MSLQNTHGTMMMSYQVEGQAKEVDAVFSVANIKSNLEARSRIYAHLRKIYNTNNIKFWIATILDYDETMTAFDVV